MGARCDERLNWRPIAPAEERTEGLVVALVEAAVPILSATRWMGLCSPLSSRDMVVDAVTCFRGFGLGKSLVERSEVLFGGDRVCAVWRVYIPTLC